MSRFRLNGLRSIDLCVPDVSADARFYTEVWGLEKVAEAEGATYFRGTGAYHHILALPPGAQPALLGITFDAHTRADVDALGFKLSDQTKMMDFVRCNNDHHSIAFANGKASTLHHIAFKMDSLDSVMRGAARMKDNGYPIEWGVGRHGPGNNVFAYFVGPHDQPIEYTAEVEEVDDDYPVRGPDYWAFPAGRTDRWGLTPQPSARMHEAQQRYTFVPQAAHG